MTRFSIYFSSFSWWGENEMSWKKSGIIFQMFSHKHKERKGRKKNFPWLIEKRAFSTIIIENVREDRESERKMRLCAGRENVKYKHIALKKRSHDRNWQDFCYFSKKTRFSNEYDSLIFMQKNPFIRMMKINSLQDGKIHTKAPSTGFRLNKCT